MTEDIVIASLRSNLSFLCWPTLDTRDRFVPLSCQSPSGGCERSAAISLFSVGRPWTTEIATFLAMTGKGDRRDCFVPRDTQRVL